MLGMPTPSSAASSISPLNNNDSFGCVSGSQSPSIISNDNNDNSASNSRKGSTTNPKQYQQSVQGFEPIPKKSAIIKTDKPRPHVCTTCTRAFARLEHLKRHERSHTNEKPFQCAACGRCFARRDLVLRHQQKLHTSLTTNNTNSKDFKKGENENIITNYGNKEVSLPTKNGHPVILDDGKHKMKRNSTSSITSSSTNQDSIPPLPPTLKNFNINKNHFPAKSTIESYNEHSTLFKHSENLRHNSISQESTESSSVQNFHHHHHHNEHQRHPNHPPPQKRHRHNSFSASSAISYTKNDELGSFHNEHELPEAPHQVGFATPQLTAQELTSKAIMSGFDLNALGLQYEIDDLNLDLNGQRSSAQNTGAAGANTPTTVSSHPNTQTTTSQQQQHQQNSQKQQPADYFQSQNGSHGITTQNNSRVSTPYQFNFTPGGNLIDMPILNEYLHIGGAGGGAGFISKNPNVNMNLFNHNSTAPSPNHHHQHQQQRARGQGTGRDSATSGHPAQSGDDDHSNPDALGSSSMSQSNSGGAGGNNNNNTSNNNNNVGSHDDTPNTSNSIHDNNSTPDDWLCEFINTPFEQNFQVSSSKNFNSIGFVPSVSPSSSTNSNHLEPLNIGTQQQHQQHQNQNQNQQKSNQETQQQAKPDPNQLFNNDIPSLFRSRQIDLFKKEIENNEEIKTSTHLFNKALRDEILVINKLNDSQFPSLSELNQYLTLYKNEFNKYFPFIHIPTLQASADNYPLLLSMASIGALYGFHSTHAMLLFNIARFRIHEFLEHEKSFKNNNNIPIWVYQCMVLCIFIGIFNNDLSITKTMTIMLNSLIELVKLTSLNLPLENFLTPPPIINDTNGKSNDESNSNNKLLEQQNFNYFTLAQTRIRTCHTILLISNLFTSLIGLDCSLHSIDVKCGIHCKLEVLWECSNYQEWNEILQKEHYVIDSKFALIELSNGNDSYNHCLNYLSLNNYILNEDDQLNKKFQMKTLLSLLMSIHEKIYLERYTLKDETNGVIKATKWRMNSRPILESLIKSWESLYIKNGGVLYLQESNLSLLFNKDPILRLILPLLSFAKIRKCIHLTPIIEKIWLKDWNGMNESLEELKDDPEALKDATNYALDIVKLWIDYVSIVNDAEKTSIRTPIFFITCIFTSLLVIAEFLLSVEKWAKNFDEENPTTYLNAIERTLWLRSEMIFKKIENNLILNENNKTYAEFLRLEAKGALDVKTLDDELAKIAMNPNTELRETTNVIKNARLSSRGLYLGVRILADAPIWPIALLFAQALKSRAIHISKSQPSTPTSN